jgi:RNA polymerase sigma-70 factor (ECF subfamily)
MNPESHENSFIELYNQYSDDIFRYCMVRLRNRDRALDVTQEVFLKLWNEYVKNPDKVSAVENIAGFIYTIARNTLIDATRKKTSSPLSFLAHTIGIDSPDSYLEPINMVSSAKNPEEQQINGELFDHLDLLDPHHRELLLFRYVHDLGISEIAEIYNISENATSVRIHRALEHAREKLSHLYDNF